MPDFAAFLFVALLAFFATCWWQLWREHREREKENRHD